MEDNKPLSKLRDELAGTGIYIYFEEDVKAANKRIIERIREEEVRLFNNMPVDANGFILWNRIQIADKIREIRERIIKEEMGKELI